MGKFLSNLFYLPMHTVGYTNAALVQYCQPYHRLWGRYKGSRLVYLAYVKNGRSSDEAIEKALRNFFRRVPIVRVELGPDGKIKVVKYDGEEW